MNPSTSVPPNGVERITVAGPRFGASESQAIVRAVGEAVSRGARAVVLEMGAVVALDVEGVVALVTIARSTAAQGVRLALANLNDRVRTLVRATHLHELIEVYATSVAAVSGVGGA